MFRLKVDENIPNKKLAVDTKIFYLFVVELDGINRHIAKRINTQVIGYGKEKREEKIDKENFVQYIIPDDIRKYGLIPEIVGRLPVLAHLNPLDKDALRRILTEPKNSIIKQYIKLFEMDGIKLTFKEEALDYIVEQAVKFKLGARGLRSICESYYVGSNV